MPQFTWGEAKDVDGLSIVKMNIEFNDGSLPDVAILNRTPLGLSDEEAENECIFEGFLTVDNSARMTVAGCPGSDTFDVIIYSNRLHHNTYDVENGVVSVYKPIPNPKQDEGTDVADIEVDEEEMRSWIANSPFTGVQDRDLPSTFTVSIALRYDNLFLTNTCGGNHALAVSRAREVVTLAQSYFRDPALGTTIELDVRSVKHVDTVARLTDGAVCGVDCTLAKMADEFTAKDTETGIDNYHYISQDPEGGTTGVARGMKYTDWTISGSVCWQKQKDRTAITEILGPDSATWNQKRMTAAETFAHELGHSLGMPHDFTTTTSTPNYDSNGQSCLTVDGIMSYKDNKDTWSQCSKEAITGWFAQLSAKQLNCKGENLCTDNCISGATNCPITSNGETIYICDNPSTYGGCNGDYKGFFDANCRKTCGICGGGTPPTPPPEVCRDQCGTDSTDCPLTVTICDMERYGGCDGGNSDYYDRYCKKKCNKCTA